MQWCCRVVGILAHIATPIPLPHYATGVATFHDGWFPFAASTASLGFVRLTPAIRGICITLMAYSLRVQSGVPADSTELPCGDEKDEFRNEVLGREEFGRSKLSSIIHITCLRFRHCPLRINLPLGDAAVFEGPHSHPSHIAELALRDGLFFRKRARNVAKNKRVDYGCGGLAEEDEQTARAPHESRT